MLQTALLCLILVTQPGDTLWCDAGDGWEFTVHFPVVALENQAVGTILDQYARGQVEEFRRNFEEYCSADDPWAIDWTLELNLLHEPSPEGMICILGWLWDYTGGAHGNTTTASFVYSEEEERLLSVVELVGGEERFRAFASGVMEHLRADMVDEGWVETGASAEEDNYHTVLPVPDDDGGIRGYTVIFPPYQVACYAVGPVEVFVPADSF